jgi:hypothetical protein
MNERQWHATELWRNVGGVSMLLVGSESLQQELKAYVNFFDQPRFEDNSEFISNLTTRLNSGSRALLPPDQLPSAQDLDQTLATLKETTNYLKECLDKNPKAAREKREAVLEQLNESTEEDIRGYVQILDCNRKELNQQFESILSQMTERRNSIKQKFEGDIIEFKAKHEAYIQKNFEYTRDFTIQFRKLEKLNEFEEEEEKLNDIYQADLAKDS